MTKYTERIPGGSLKMHKIEPDLQLIANVASAKKKKVKQEKENAENPCHKILLTQPSPSCTSLSNTTTKLKPNPNPNTLLSPPSLPLVTGPIKDSPGIWSVSSNDTVIYGTPLQPVLVKPLLNPKCNQYCALPVEDPKLWAFYKKQVTSFWTPEEIDFLDDMKHLPTLPPDQLHFVSMVLSQFLCHQ
jgi:hypothetical protein